MNKKIKKLEYLKKLTESSKKSSKSLKQFFKDIFPLNIDKIKNSKTIDKNEK